LKRKHRFLAIGAIALLLLAQCVPVFSGALAAEEEKPLIVPIGQETALFGADGEQIGTLKSNHTFVPMTGESPSSVIVIYDHAAANKAVKSDTLAGKTLVLLSYPDSTAAAEPTPEVAEATLPTQGWIDASLVVTAHAAQHAADLSKLAAKDATISSLQSAAQAAGADNSASGAQMSGKEKAGIFSADKMEVWVPVAAIALGVLGIGLLAWLAISTATTAWDTESQTRLLIKLNERLTEGLSMKTPLRVEQIAWPQEGHVRLAPDVVEQLAAASQSSAYSMHMSEPVQPVVVEPDPIPEGEEPDLLQLANRLAGVAAAAEWHALVKDAGWRAVLLQSNPTEKGTYIADDSGYSIIACLMRSADAELAYVVPSYQDPNASEQRWSEFYAVTEDMAVRNYRVDALAVMYIERGTFFLQKSKGKLIRRPQFF